MQSNLVDTVNVVVKSIVAKLIYDIQEDQETCRDPDTHPEDIDRGKKLVLENVSECKLKIITKHRFNLWLKTNNKMK